MSADAALRAACEECCWEAYITGAINPDGTLVNPCTHV